MNYEKASLKDRSSKGTLKSRKSERQSIVKKPTSKGKKKQPKKISVSYTLKNGVMPYGKFKNWKIRDLPTEYITWAILNLDENYNTVVKSVLEALAIEMIKRDPSLS